MTYSKAISLITDGTDKPFGLDEVIYSRADSRGVILSGNEAFRRVSGHEWEDLIGVPHRKLRNPDTPRAVFFLMWKTIQQGKPICVLVKNRAGDGRWFWVLAVVVPIEGGYLWLAFKPTSGLFAQTRATYATLVAAEQAQSLSSEVSCSRLLASLADAGFASYNDFTIALLQQEMAGPNSALWRDNDTLMQALARLDAKISAVRQEQQALMSEFDDLQSVPTNMRIIASRLEPSGGPISAISDNYKLASTEIARRMESIAGTEQNQCQRMADITGEAMLKFTAAQLMSKLSLQFSREGSDRNPVNLGAEMSLLSAVKRQYVDTAQAAILKVGHIAGDFNEASTEIRRMTLGLDTIRVMGKVESGHLGQDGGGLSSTIDQLDSRHAVIAQNLQRLMDLTTGIKAMVRTFSHSSVTDAANEEDWSKALHLRSTRL